MSAAHVTVASCGENLDWLEDVDPPVTVYDASGSCRRADAVRVPNRGREAGMYLRRIVEAYPDFAEHEIFLQGDPFRHAPGVLAALRNACWRRAPFVPVGRMTPLRRRSPQQHERWALKFAAELELELPRAMNWVVGAQFAVSRERMLARPREWWERLWEKVLADADRSPWAMERLWFAVLGPPPGR